MNRRAMFPLIRAMFALTAPALLIACSADPQAAAAPEPPLAGASIGGEFTLVDKAGKTVRWSDFDGSWRTVYFGYTFCPDACPLDMQVLMKGFQAFEKKHPDLAAKVQPLFITIDPERDGPKEVGEFAAAFHPRLIGLTGTTQQVDSAAKAFAAYYQKGEETAGGYLMDHARVAYLMDPQGKPIAILPIDESPKAVTAELEKWVR
jgi:protein SCO1/2